MKKLFCLLALMVAGVVSAMAVEPSGTLPVLYINIENGQEVVTKDPYLNAVYWLDPRGCEGVQAFGSPEEPLELKIKGRGNYTFSGFDKKPYRLKLSAKAGLLGMKKSKHFGLLAHADDNKGFLRNTIGFKVSEIVGLPWTPAAAPVEVVINGSYRGLYFLTELIRIDKDRVNIDPWQDEEEVTADDGTVTTVPLARWIEGGSLVEIDNYDEEAQIRFQNPEYNDALRFTYDKSVDPGFEPEGYVDWLKSSLGNVNNLILNGDRNSDNLWEYLDIDDCARFITVQEFMHNYESFHGSCYLFRQKGDGEKWHFSPVWDFGSAFQRNHPDRPFYEDSEYDNHWVRELMERPALRERVAYYWGILNSRRDEINQYASDFIASITQAAAADKQRWPQYGNDNLQGRLNEVKGYMNSSASYMNDNFGGGSSDTPDIYLIGQFNEWGLADGAYKFSYEGNNVYTYTAAATIEGEWKINQGNWNDKSWGLNGNQPELNVLYNLGHQDAPNITTPIPAGAKLIFTYSASGTSTLLIQTEAGPTPPADMPDIYLVGGFNGWNEKDAGYKFNYQGDYVYTFEVAGEITEEWKICQGTWDKTSWGNNGIQPALNVLYNLGTEGDHNITTDLPAGAKLIFTYSASGTSTLLIQTEEGPTPPTPPTPDFQGMTVFFDNSTARWDEVACYAWTDGEKCAEWPGMPMELLEGDIWKITFSRVYQNVIFNNNNKGQQTADLNGAHGNVYTKDAEKYSEGTSFTPTNPLASTKIKVVTEGLTHEDGFLSGTLGEGAGSFHVNFEMADGHAVYFLHTPASTASYVVAADGFTLHDGNDIEVPAGEGTIAFRTTADGISYPAASLSYKVEAGTTGIGTIEADDAHAEYYNLQGLRVENPAGGIFIRIQGGNAMKVRF